MCFNIVSFHLIVILIPFSVSVIVCPTFKDYFFTKMNRRCYDNPDGDAEYPSSIIKRHGFNSKSYNITTDDGYIISVERLSKIINKKTPIIIGPGILMNSFAYVNRGNKSLAFFLANHGYQVWIINWRGTKFSRAHKFPSPSNEEYWNMGFDEMAEYDLKSVIEKVFKESKSKAIYLGYSMGTTVGLIANIKQQKSAEKTLKGMVHLAPVARMKYSKSILKYLYPLWPLVKPLLYYLGQGKIRINRRNKNLCGPHPFKILFCESIFHPIFGNGLKFFDPLTYPITSTQNRDALTIKILDHYYQIMKRNSFVEFSYGKIRNLLEYSSLESPEYDLEEVTLPQSLLVGEKDIIATPKDTKYLYDHIPKSSQCGYSLVENFQHRDFVIANNVENVLFGKVLESIERIDNGKCD